MKMPVCVSLHPLLVMVIGPVTALAGTVAVICVALLTVNTADILFGNFTELTPLKFAPVIITLVFICPLVGLMLLTVGHCGGTMTVKLPV